ncbi:MAG: sugar ABC transporter permease [Propionibacteriaceae bacterium]|jgi:multiple sugar transport system permease protein|nr:sugar ABC transporter permease [Propionibacteriaceae bacterium]
MHALRTWLDRRIKWILIAPATLFVLVLIAYPIVFTANLSLTDAKRSTTRPSSFVGFENFWNLLTDTHRFWPAVGRTAFFTVAAITIEMILGILIALSLRKAFRGQAIVRVAMLLPLVATPVAVGVMWMLILEPNTGVANMILRNLGLPEPLWLADPSLALNTLILIDAWQWTPMVALIVLAGLTQIPSETEEAADIDGAGLFKKTWSVILPQASGSILAALLIRSIDAFKTFDILYATKGPGGGSNHEVETLNILAYSLSFDYQQYGRASAVLVLFLTLLICVVTSIVLMRRAVTR